MLSLFLVLADFRGKGTPENPRVPKVSPIGQGRTLSASQLRRRLGSQVGAASPARSLSFLG